MIVVCQPMHSRDLCRDNGRLEMEYSDYQSQTKYVEQDELTHFSTRVTYSSIDLPPNESVASLPGLFTRNR